MRVCGKCTPLEFDFLETRLVRKVACQNALIEIRNDPTGQSISKQFHRSRSGTLCMSTFGVPIKTCDQTTACNCDKLTG